MKLKVVILATMMAVLTVVSASAQSGKVDVYGGASYQYVNGVNFFGWEGSATYNTNSWLGLTLDGAQTYNHGTNSYLMVGPTFSITPLSGKHFKPFAGAYVGTDIAPDPNGGYNNGWGWMLGGGFDIPINKRFSVRPVNLNYYGFNHHFFDQSLNFNSLWYSAGFVIHF